MLAGILLNGKIMDKQFIYYLKYAHWGKFYKI